MECSHFVHSSHGDAVMHHTELQGRFVVAASSAVDTAPLPVAHLPPPIPRILPALAWQCRAGRGSCGLFCALTRAVACRRGRCW